ncbi:T9SS type A sorting domain-containing protein [bacterium]|nr:T9SS type A sorting domain-containing protein [bacterium]
MRPAHHAFIPHFWVFVALALLVPSVSVAYTTPGTGVSWTADSLVTHSDGVVSWNAEQARWESTETLVISQTDSLAILGNIHVDDNGEQDYLVHGSLLIGLPEGEPTDSVIVSGEPQEGFDDGPGGFRVSSTGRLHLIRAILEGGGMWGLNHAVWVDGGYADLNGCRIFDWIGSGAQATAGGTLELDGCFLHDLHEGGLILNGIASVHNTTILRFNQASANLDNAAITIPTTSATLVEIENCIIEGSDNNQSGGIRIDNIGEQDQAISINGSVIENCAYGIWISGAYSTMDVEACTLRTNTALDDLASSGEGLRVESGASVRAAGNVFVGNAVGVRLQQTIDQPLALQLGTSGSEDPLARGYNRFVENGYDGNIVAIENFSPHAVSAQNNYWGSDDPLEIDSWIVDDDEIEMYGAVTIQPLWNGDEVNFAPVLSGILPENDHPSIIRGQTFLFAALGTDPDGDDNLLEWEWFQDGEAVVVGTDSVEFSFGPTDPTPLEIAAVVTDEAGGNSRFIWYITLLDQPPPTIVTQEPSINELTIEAGSGLDFEYVGDVNGRYDLFYRFERNGATIAEEESVTVFFDDPAVEEITAYVWYESEAGIGQASNTWTINVVEPTPPELEEIVPDTGELTVTLQELVNFYVEASGPGGWPISYEYHFVGGEPLSEFQDFAHRFDEVGEFDLEVVAWYGEGGESRSVSHTWHILVQTDSAVDEPDVPQEFSLGSYPNPFNATLRLQVALPQHERVTINIYDPIGRLVDRLTPGTLAAGQHMLAWDASKVGSGVYFVRLSAGEFVNTQKVVLIR